MNKNTIKWSLIGLLVIAGIWLTVDHGQHLAPYLPFAFLLGCLAMHLFMHAGHGSHGNHNSDTKNDEVPSTHNRH